MKEQATDWEKTFAKHIYLIKGFVSKTYKELLNSTMRKKKKHLQYEQKIWADTPPKENTQMSNKHIKKDTQYHMSLKLQIKGNATTHPIE